MNKPNRMTGFVIDKKNNTFVTSMTDYHELTCGTCNKKWDWDASQKHGMTMPQAPEDCPSCRQQAWADYLAKLVEQDKADPKYCPDCGNQCARDMDMCGNYSKEEYYCIVCWRIKKHYPATWREGEEFLTIEEINKERVGPKRC